MQKIAFTPRAAVKVNKVYTELVVGRDSDPEESPALDCDCFVKRLRSLGRINGSQK